MSYNFISKIEKKPLPKVGMRVVKTLVSVSMIVIIYSLIDRNPCFACIGAVFGMGKVLTGGLKSGGNRFIGTLVGGMLVIPTYWLMYVSNLRIPNWVCLMLGLFLILYISQLLGAHDAIQPGTVVFFVVLYTVTSERYIAYTVARIIDTGLGVLLSLIINKIFPSPLEDEKLLEQEEIEIKEEEAELEKEINTAI